MELPILETKERVQEPTARGVTDGSRLGQFKRRLGGWLDEVRDNEHQLALLLSLVIGALVGLVIVAFILLTGRLAARMYPADVGAWRRLLVPTLGSLVAGYLLFQYFPLARGSGIPQTKFALFVTDGLITLRTVVGKFVCCAVSLSSGIALGREGPSVQIGAGLASAIAYRLGLSPERVKALIPVGGSAALAAAFNTPIAGVLFSLEEIMGDLHAPILGAAVLSSATAWMVLHLVLGDEPLFHVAGYQLVHPSELAIYAVLGVIGGFASVAFVKLLLFLRQRFLALGEGRAWLYPVVGGLTVGLLGLFVPEVLGVGYDYVERVLNGDVVLRVLVLLAVLKIVATAVCYASGNAGGIFGPSLFIGAMVGGAVGSAAHGLFPAYTAEPGAYALVGMGTAFAGIVRTPLTSVIMIFELTRDYTIIVPLMISNLIAFYVSHRLQRVPIYEAIARQDGVHLPTAESRGNPGTPRVAQAMRPAPAGVSPFTRVAEAATHATDSAFDAWPTMDHEGFIGMTTAEDLRAAMHDGMADRPLTDVHRTRHQQRRASSFSHLHPDHSLAMALERMGSTGQRVLPVVSRANVRQLMGLITLGDVLATFGVTHSQHAAAPPARTSAPPPGGTFLATLGLIVATIGALVVVDIWLARTERAETRADAVRLFDQGRALEAQGRHTVAIERFQSALSLRRSERSYQLALASAMLGDGRPIDARRVLDDVLRHDATDANANLTMAHVLRRLGERDDAVSYYQRAIHGRWDADAPQHRTEVRLELVDLLTPQGSKEELLAELLPLQATGDEAIARRIAPLFLAAGAPDRALDVWLDVRREHPNDPSVHAGIGEAELARRDYRAAQASFQKALRLDPDNQRTRGRLALCEDVLALDPTRRGLKSGQRYERSVALLNLVEESLRGCPEAGPPPDPAPVAVPGQPRTAAAREEATEGHIQLAEELWQRRVQQCSRPLSSSEERLALVLSKTSQ